VEVVILRPDAIELIALTSQVDTVAAEGHFVFESTVAGHLILCDSGTTFTLDSNKGGRDGQWLNSDLQHVSLLELKGSG
jgi:hypothetical protein